MGKSSSGFILFTQLLRELALFHIYRLTVSSGSDYKALFKQSHTKLFYSSLDFVWDYPGEPAPERQNQSGFY